MQMKEIEMSSSRLQMYDWGIYPKCLHDFWKAYKQVNAC